MAKPSDRLQANDRRRSERRAIRRGIYLAGDIPIERAEPPPKGPMAGFHGKGKTSDEKGGA